MSAQSATTHNLPAQPTSFIGRQKETAEVLDLLTERDCRLLTLVGIGGSGKTRLATQVAECFVRHTGHDACFVPLQSADSRLHLVSAIAAALRFPLSGQDAPRRQLLHYLHGKSLLLVLDNFEQLLPSGGALLLTELLAAAPGVRLLITSREILSLQEEWLYPLSALTFPRPTLTETASGEHSDSSGDEHRDAHRNEYSALHLFDERARRVRPNFSLDEERAGVIRICQLVEGLPLALELAASWVRTLPCAAIADEIERNLHFLTSTVRNVHQAHRSMEAIFAQTWSQLSPTEQAVFARLALFRDGFRREAAEQVAGASVEVLMTLVDKSLLRWQPDERYQIHELLRQYAANELARSPELMAETRQRHAEFYLRFLHARFHAMIGAGQRQACTEITADLDNVRTAWRTAAQSQMVDAIGGASEPLCMYFFIKGPYSEAAELFRHALDALTFTGESQQLVQAHLAVSSGWLALRLGQFAEAEAYYTQSQQIYQHLQLPPVPGMGTDPLLGLSIVASVRGDAVQAADLGNEALQRATTHDHRHNVQSTHFHLASIAYATGDYRRAHTHAEAACALCQQTGDQWFLAYCLSEMGRAALALGEHEAARQHFEEGYSLRASFADPEGMALALYNLGEVALRQQQHAQAQGYFERSIAIYRDINDRGGLAAAHSGLAKTATAQIDAAQSATAQSSADIAQEHFRQALEIADDMHFTPLLLDILAATGQFLVQTDRVQPGLSLLHTVQENPATDQETRTTVQQQMRHYRSTLPPKQVSGVASSYDLATATEIAQTALTAAIPTAAIPTAAITTTAIPTTAITTHAEASPAPPEEIGESLTEREMEVLHLIDQGLTNPQIARKLILAVGTVKYYSAAIYRKLGVNNRIRAIARARELRLLG